MTLPPLKELFANATVAIIATKLTFTLTNYASFNQFLTKPPFSSFHQKAFPSDERESITQTQFVRLWGRVQKRTECRTITLEEEDLPLLQKNLRKIMDIEFIAAKRNRNSSPLIVIKQQKWDNVKDCCGTFLNNVRHRLSVRDNIILNDDRVVIPKQLRPTPVNALHLTQPGKGSVLEAD